MTIKERDTLQLHSDPWGLWCSRGFDTATLVKDEESFLHSLHTDPALRVRLLGTAHNASLILRLMGTDLPVEVASPTICPPDDLRDAQAVMYSMRRCSLPPSLGGWHRVTPEDYRSYQHIDAWRQNGGFTTQVAATYSTHPASHALNFIPSLSVPDAAELLTLIVDPRWFIDPEAPYRISRLRAFLGLMPRHVRNLDKKAEPGSALSRCQLVMRTWQGPQQPTPNQLSKAGHFLWRRHKQAGGGQRGLLRASSAFVTYLARTWHQAMLASSPRPVEMFLPTSFFKSRELTAYRKHMLSSG